LRCRLRWQEGVGETEAQASQSFAVRAGVKRKVGDDPDFPVGKTASDVSFTISPTPFGFFGLNLDYLNLD
jgi:hypothetical protein